MNYFIFIILGYLSGSILYAYFIPKLILNVDIREKSNDGNPGTVNAFMNSGIFLGIIVLIFELGKGFIPVWISTHFVDLENWLFVGILVAPVLGHAFPLFSLKNGGKAIAVSFGSLLGLFPIMEPVLILAFFYILFSVVIIVNPHFFRSIITFFLFSFFCIFLVENKAIILGCCIISVIVVFKHFMKYEAEKLKITPFYKLINDKG